MTSAMRKLSLALLALAVIVPARAHADSKDAKPAASDSSSTESAGGEEDNTQQKQTEKSGAKTLEERIRPVSGSLFIRKSRSELEPVVGISFNDAFFQKYMIGLRYAYHATDSFSVELGGAFGISMPSGEVNTCTAQGCQTPTKDQLQGTPGNIGLMVGASATWSPLYGKLNIVAEKVLHFDTFFLAGLDGIQYAEPSLDPTNVAPVNTFTFGGHFGIGQHFVINDFTALRVELRDYLYSGQRAVNGAFESHLENQFMLDIGVSFFFPLHPTE